MTLKIIIIWAEVLVERKIRTGKYIFRLLFENKKPKTVYYLPAQVSILFVFFLKLILIIQMRSNPLRSIGTYYFLFILILLICINLTYAFIVFYFILNKWFINTDDVSNITISFKNIRKAKKKIQRLNTSFILDHIHAMYTYFMCVHIFY